MNGAGYPSRDGGWQSSSRDYYSSRPDLRDDRRGHDRDRERDRGERVERGERLDRGDRGERVDRGDRDRAMRDRDRDRERRRSRSPAFYGPRPSRREPELDSYSTSRDYREREREDRHSGRDRRDERGWDRERGAPRRDGRREDDDRAGRREREPPRDPMEDRARASRKDRDGPAFGGRERKRSGSPPAKKKEPTPDLTDVAPISERKRRLTQWDIKPPGYENVTAEQAKLSGMFPLPGAPRQQAMDPSRLQAFMAPQGGMANNAILKPSNARQAKRLFVTNLPKSVTEDSLVQFFNLHLNGLNVIEGVDPCIAAQLSPQQELASLEFKTAADATVALAFDGISMDDEENVEDNGVANGHSRGLAMRRPKDYMTPLATDHSHYQEGVVSSVVPDSPNKICVTSIPKYLTDEQVTELLVTFGELKAFVLFKDRESQESRGIAFIEYVDPAATEIAIEGLNGMPLGDQHLKLCRASGGVQQALGLEMGVHAMSMFAGTTSQELQDGRVLQLLNMVTPEELMDNDEYEEICADIKEECERFGQVLEMKVPRPTGGSRQATGVGKIYVKFDEPESAAKALRALAGRKFADRTVVTTYFPEDNFEVSAW